MVQTKAIVSRKRGPSWRSWLCCCLPLASSTFDPLRGRDAKALTMATRLAPIAPAATAEATATLRERLDRVRTLSLALVAGLSDADASAQSTSDASPSKWHLAHTTWFFETFVLRDFVPNYDLFNPRFSFLYNSYYEAEGTRIARPSRGLLTRPSLDEIRAYRAHVDAAMKRVLHGLPTAGA